MKKVKLCNVCGINGDKACSRCHSVNYCSPHHQRIHWSRNHKQYCLNADLKNKDGQLKTENDTWDKKGVLFPEFEIVTEPEVLDQAKIATDQVELFSRLNVKGICEIHSA